MDPDAYATLGVRPDATQAELKAAHRALVRRHHPDVVPEDERPAATRRIQQINVAYGLVRDASQRAEYDRLRRLGGVDFDALVVAAGRWAGRWWGRNRRQVRLQSERVRVRASRGGAVGRRAAANAAGRVAWLLLCAFGLATGLLLALAAQRLAGVEGPWTQLAGALGGIAVGNQRGWHIRRRLAGLPRAPGALRLGAVAAVLAVSVGLWLDSL